MKSRTLIVNLGVGIGSLMVSLVLAEGIARVALNPADYLSVELQHDPILGAKATGKTAAGAFDAWGFRNAGVPPSAEIVAIGDSHTYGNAATMAQSWPYVLADATGKPVYNMGMGGYGPNQYAHLLTQALELSPKTVVVGLYMGDDFENAFLVTYGLEHWSRLRALPAHKVDFDIWSASTKPPPVSAQKALRIWLSRHSVVYQLVVHGPLLGRIQGEAQIRQAARPSDAVTALDIPEAHILEAFRPQGVRRNLDQQSAQVAEGMRITFSLLREMKQRCLDKRANFVVAVIPTKEMVFAQELQQRADLPLARVIAELLVDEAKARERTFAELRAAGIAFVDTLPALREARGAQLYARTAGDMHPNGNGYRVIGQTVAAALRDREPVRP
jgi:hypothetical protein